MYNDVLQVVNAIKAQWWMHDKFTAVLSHFLSLVQTMYQRCSSSLEVIFFLLFVFVFFLAGGVDTSYKSFLLTIFIQNLFR